MQHLSAIALFVQTADSLSFVAAGKNLGLTASAVGKSVARLEQHLGVRLFHRDTRNMTLTDEGHILLARSRQILADLQAAEAEVTSRIAEPVGRLRISMPLSFEFMMPLMAEFMSKHPSILLDIDMTDRVVDMIDEGFDMVIRTGTFTDNGLMRRALWRFDYVLAASPSYLATHNMPDKPTDLSGHACLRQRSRRTGKLYDWEFSNGKTRIPETATVSELAPLVQLAMLGKGIGYFPRFAVGKQIEGGALVTLLDSYIDKTEQMAVLWPTSRQLSPRIRSMVGFLTDHAKTVEAESRRPS